MSERTVPPVMVAVDFSENGRKAFDAAMNLAEDMSTSLIIVHVYPELKTPSLMMGDLEKQVMDEAKAEISKEEAMTLAEEWVSVARKRGLDVDVVASGGDPVDTILAAAKERNVGLLVVGTHGRTGLKHLLMGSVAEDIIRRSDRPVLVVPHKAKKGR